MKIRLILLSCALSLGCISVPDDIRAEFEAPDGQRPNNFGRFDEAGKVVPDRPTIHSALAGEAAPVESRS
ncbi:MAG TPA: hypothetical protein DEA08_02735 [Planctomycetes bacterium]|nr:hypothetical protein [Planctomycetota bacterium]